MGMPSNERAPRSRARWIPTVITAVAGVAAAWWAMPDHIQGGDAGEFATVLLRGGIPHPPGYPWMRLLSPLARLGALMDLSPARAAALPCALAGALAWVVMQRSMNRWDLPWVGAFTTVLVLLSPPVMVHVNDSEVWGLHLLFSAIVSWVCLRPRRVTPFPAGVLLGLAMSHHLTAVLLAPLVIGAAWPLKRSIRAFVVSGVEGLIGTMLGLMPYLTLLTGNGEAWRWGRVDQLHGLVRHVLRVDYGMFQLSLHETSPPVMDLWSRAVANVGESLSAGLIHDPWAGLLLMIGVAVLAWWGRPSAVPTPAWWGYWTTLMASQLGFPAITNIDPRSPFGAWILERFDLLTLALWVPALTLAAARLLRLVQRTWWHLAWGLVALGLIGSQILHANAHGLPSDEDAVEHYALDVLHTPPPEQLALIIGTDDHRLFPILFAEHVLEQSGKALYIDASLLSRPWYRQYLRQRWNALPEADKPLQLMGILWRDVARRDIPIYLTNVFSRPAATKLELVPEGVLWRVVPPHADPDAFAPRKLARRHLQCLERYHGAVPSPHPAHPWADDVAATYVETSRRLADVLQQTGHDGQAESILAELEALQARAATR